MTAAIQTRKLYTGGYPIKCLVQVLPYQLLKIQILTKKQKRPNPIQYTIKLDWSAISRGLSLQCQGS